MRLWSAMHLFAHTLWKGGNIMDDLLSFVKPEFAALVAALYCLGVAFKHSESIPDHWIPLLLTVCGVGLAALSIAGRFWSYANFAAAAFDAVVQGSLCAGMSVYVNQLIKQYRANK